MSDDNSADSSDPPEDVPAQVAEALEESSDRQLRATIEYAQHLLSDRWDRTSAVEARPGEEIVRTVDHEGYTVAIVRPAGDAGGDDGSIAYRVTREPSIEGEETFRWHYLGRVER